MAEKKTRYGKTIAAIIGLLIGYLGTYAEQLVKDVEPQANAGIEGLLIESSVTSAVDGKDVELALVGQDTTARFTSVDDGEFQVSFNANSGGGVVPVRLLLRVGDSPHPAPKPEPQPTPEPEPKPEPPQPGLAKKVAELAETITAPQPKEVAREYADGLRNAASIIGANQYSAKKNRETAREEVQRKLRMFPLKTSEEWRQKVAEPVAALLQKKYQTTELTSEQLQQAWEEIADGLDFFAGGKSE